MTTPHAYQVNHTLSHIHIYHVFKQLPPKPRQVAPGVVEYRMHLVEVGKVEAASGAEAIDRAKELAIFKYANRATLAAFPIVRKQETYG